MVDLSLIKNYFPEQIRDNTVLGKSMIKEYIQLSILDYLSTTQYIRKLIFIGGSNLRLVKGIDRFSEDLDFDCKVINKEEFMQMSDDVMNFLKRDGYEVETKDKDSPKLTAFRRNIYFPFPVPPDAVLCAMKATALLERGKGRDFYDLMFLLGQTKPDYDYLAKRTGIKNAEEFKAEVKKRIKITDLKVKTKDFEHLLFNKENTKRILRFEEFFEESIL